MDLSSVVPPWLLKFALESLVRAWEKHRERVAPLAKRQDPVDDSVRLAITRHLQFIESWSSQVTLASSPRSRSLSDVFVELSFGVGRDSRVRGLVSLAGVLVSNNHSVILGHPGAGKTTVVKYFCQKLLSEAGGVRTGSRFPVLVPLRDLRADIRLIDHLLVILGLSARLSSSHSVGSASTPVSASAISAAAEIARKEEEEAREREATLVDFLNEAQAVILLDGLDEMRPEHASEVTQQIKRLANLLTSAKIVLTCRIGAFSSAIDNSEVLTLLPLEGGQVLTLAQQWFGSSETASQFLNAVSRSPFADIVGRPLVLANLCLVYQAYGELPEQPVLVYQRVVNLLLEDWDRQRDIQRASRYGGFGPERKRQFLGALAFDLATRGQVVGAFSRTDLRNAFERVHEPFGLPLYEEREVVEEIESHSGLIVSTGLERFDFCHKSLREFLCAEHMSRMPRLDKEMRKIARLPDECAIATVLSSDPNAVLSLLVQGIVHATELDSWFVQNQVQSFWNPYLARLLSERVRFAKNPRTGTEWLVLASLAWGGGHWPETEEPHQVQGGQILVDVLELLGLEDSLAASIQIAAAFFEVDRVGHSCLRLVRRNDPRSTSVAFVPESLVLHGGVAARLER